MLHTEKTTRSVRFFASAVEFKEDLWYTVKGNPDNVKGEMPYDA